MFRPQFPYPPAPPGFVWQPCVFQFDSENTPAFSAITLGSGVETGDIPLRLDHDAPFVLLAVKIVSAGLNVALQDPWTNPLTDDFVDPSVYASQFPPTVLEGGRGIEVPARAVFRCRLQGQ